MRRVFGIFSASTAIVVALSLIAAAGTAGLVIVVGQGLDELLSDRRLGTQWYFSAVGELLAMAVATFLIPVVISRNSQDLTEHHRMKLLKHYLSIGPLAVRAAGEGELVHAAMDSVERSVKYRSSFIGPAVSAVATPVLILCFIAFAIDPLSALLMLVPTALVPIIVLGFQRRFGASNGENTAEPQGILSATFLDAAFPGHVLKLNGAGGWMGVRIEKATERVRQQVMSCWPGNQADPAGHRFKLCRAAARHRLPAGLVARRLQGDLPGRSAVPGHPQLPDARPGELRGQLLLHRG